MIDIYFVRHGKTLWNDERRMQGIKNSPLTAEGISDAHKLSAKIDNLNISNVYCSPMPRALQTAYIATKGLLPITIEPLLIEMNLGDMEGRPFDEGTTLWGEDFYNYRYCPDKYIPIGDGESYYDVEKRVRKLLTKLLDTDKPVLLVTHMLFILTLLCVIEGREISTLRDIGYINQTSLYRFQIEKTDSSYRCHILMRNDEPCDEWYEFNL